MAMQHGGQWRVEDRPVRVGLYLMTKPDEAAARTLHRVALRTRAREGLVGRATDPDRLHVTLVPFAVDEDWSRQGKRIEAALAEVAFPVFRASVDRLYSFGAGARFPLVATADDGVLGFHRLREALIGALDRHRIAHHASNAFNPHVTLLRDPRIVGQTFFEPVGWTVKAVDLVLSLVEARRHIVLARRTLMLADAPGSA